jgi:hypothetical protein
MIVLSFRIRVTQLGCAVLVKPRDQEAVDDGIADDARPHEGRYFVDALASQQSLAARDFGSYRVEARAERIVPQPLFNPCLHLRRTLAHGRGESRATRLEATVVAFGRQLDADAPRRRAYSYSSRSKAVATILR